MKIVWTRRALRHLVAVRQYIARDSEQNASLVAERVLEAVELLRSQPDLGRPGRILGTRELVIADAPYIIPYRVRQGRVELLAVLHASRQWPSKL